MSFNTSREHFSEAHAFKVVASGLSKNVKNVDIYYHDERSPEFIISH